MIKSKNVLIIGATSAIAQEVANFFAEEQAHVLLAGRNRNKLEAMSCDLKTKWDSDVSIYPFEISDTDQHQHVFDLILKDVGAIDVALIAHGVLGDQIQLQNDTKKTLELLQVNLLSTISLLTILANEMERKGEGTIAVISSVASDRGRQSNYIYGASKGGITTFLQGLRNRCAKKNVHVLTIKPGLVDTPMTEHIKKKPLSASPVKVGSDIYHAICAKRNEIYTPWYWRYIMLVIKCIPEPIFKRLKL